MAEQSLAALPLPQLRAQLQEERHAFALLQTEAEMLEKWYCKMEPSDRSLSKMRDASPDLTQRCCCPCKGCSCTRRKGQAATSVLLPQLMLALSFVTALHPPEQRVPGTPGMSQLPQSAVVGDPICPAQQPASSLRRVQENPITVGQCWLSKSICIVLWLLQTRGRYKSKLYSATDCFLGLTMEQKCELAERALMEMKDETQRMKEDSEQTLQNLEAVLEEADVWWADVKKAIGDFEEDLISTISSKKGNIIASEKLLRYLEGKNRQRDLLREKLHAKNYVLMGYKKKLQQQLRQLDQNSFLETGCCWHGMSLARGALSALLGLSKLGHRAQAQCMLRLTFLPEHQDWMGETICEVRLQQLHIRNAQCQEKTDLKNQELLQLKLTLGKMVKVLNLYKRKLHDAMEMSKSLMKDVSHRKELLEEIEREAAHVEEQRAEAESVNRQLRKQLSDYRVPSVLSYVRKIMAVSDLEKSLKAWETKVAVAKMYLQGYRRVWKQVKMSGHQH
ncbi:cilia- and flagella-associated protein 263 [Rhynochetos jubatus]